MNDDCSQGEICKERTKWISGSAVDFSLLIKGDDISRKAFMVSLVIVVGINVPFPQYAALLLAPAYIQTPSQPMQWPRVAACSVNLRIPS